MNEPQLISQVEELGLSNKEARVYVACLKVGPSPVQRIADQADIKRVTTYVILESLVGMGLVTQTVKGKKTFFVAEEPAVLKQLVDKREQQLKAQKLSLAAVLPQLAQLKTVPKDLPEVKYYDGVESVKGLLTNFFADYRGDASDVYGIRNADQLNAFFPNYAEAGNQSRVKRRIKSHLVYTSQAGAIYQATDQASHRVSRFMAPDKYPISGDIRVLGDYVVIISLSDSRPTGVTLRNADMARSMRAVFDMVWELAGQQPTA